MIKKTIIKSLFAGILGLVFFASGIFVNAQIPEGTEGQFSWGSEGAAVAEEAGILGMIFGGVFIGLVGIIIAVLLLPIVLICYLLLALGLFKMAKKRNIENAWIAFIPVFQVYIIGKLIEPLKLGKTEIPQISVILGAGAVAVIFLGWLPLIGQLISLAFFALLLVSLYKLYEAYSPQNAVLFTVLSIIPGLAPILVFVIRNKEPQAASETSQENPSQDQESQGEESSE